VAMQHGVNANLLRKWVAGQQRQQRNGVAVGAIECATEVIVPVVELCGVAGPPEPPVPPLVQHHVQPAKAGRHTDLPAGACPVVEQTAFRSASGRTSLSRRVRETRRCRSGCAV
jgi:hypothetical protein